MSTTIREYLISFIRKSVSEKDYEEGLGYAKDEDTFESYEQFIDYGENMLHDCILIKIKHWYLYHWKPIKIMIQ